MSDIHGLVEALSEEEFYAFVTWLETVEQPRRARLREEAERMVNTLREFRVQGLLKAPTVSDDYPGYNLFDPDVIYAPGEKLVKDKKLYRLTSRLPMKANLDDPAWVVVE